MLIAANPNAGSIMGLVTNAWGLFGAAFGPAIMLSLFWRRFNFAGAAAGIIIGAAADIAWLYLCPKTGIYELLPGFVIGAIGAVVVTLLTRAPSAEVMQQYDRAVTYDDKTVDCNE